MTLTAPALPAELPPHHRPIPRILAFAAAIVIASTTMVAGATASAQAFETLVANDDLFFVEPGQAYTRTAAQGLLANDQYPAGTSLEVVSYSEPVVGAFALLADGSFTWTAPADFCDVLTFTYVAGDGVMSSGPATVTLYASISGKSIECEQPNEAPGGVPGGQPGDQPAEEPGDEPSSPTSPTLPAPTDPGTPGDEPELSDAPATPARDTLAYTGAADELAQGLGWGALLAIMLGLGLTVSRVRRGAGA